MSNGVGQLASSIAAFFAIRRIVTPFTPYVISTYFLSDEVRTFRKVRWLNPTSRDLADHASDVKDHDLVFCEIDLIPTLVEKILPKIRSRFTLITGGRNLPGLEQNEYTAELIRSEKVVLWFSHNMIFEHSKCHPFPYGVTHRGAHAVLREMGRRITNRKREIYFSYVSAWPHMTDQDRRDRELLAGSMDRRLPLAAYLAKVHSYCFVASPVGDRPDTYRHWECLALGAVPISNVPGIYRKLFGSNMLYLQSMKDIFDLDPRALEYSPPDVRIVAVDFWRQHVRNVARNAR
jgi:hypothetical protein